MRNIVFRFELKAPSIKIDGFQIVKWQFREFKLLIE